LQLGVQHAILPQLTSPAMLSTPPPASSTPPTPADVEKTAGTQQRVNTAIVSPPSDADYLPRASDDSERLPIWKKLSAAGVEHRGSRPVPVELRTDTNYFNIFTTMCTPMLSILPIGTGIVPAQVFKLSLLNSFLLIFFFSFVFTAPAAYMITVAPLTGMRQMLQSRYSYGYWPNVVVTFLTMITVGGFSVIACSIGSQCLVALSEGKVPQEVAILLIIAPAMGIAFFGLDTIHRYLRWGWVPTLFAIFCIIGYGAPGLKLQHETPPPTVYNVFSMVALMAGYMVSWANVVGDYAIYMPPSTPKWRLFTYCLLGLCLPITAMLTLGCAIGGAIDANPTWLASYEKYSIGGALAAILARGGGFGKFVLVLLTFSVIGTTSRDMYSISVDFHVLIPRAYRVPRVVWVLVTGGAIIGVAIGAIHAFYAALTNFINFIGYWAACYTSVIVLEFWWFRDGSGASFDHAIWKDPTRLPYGWAAVAASVIPWAMVVPCMDQTWYTGPIAKKTGDLGFEVALVLACLIYVPARKWEIKRSGGHVNRG
jgi:purine-cytosine permease-like protein